ncbi:F-box protein [Abeliophyllum distichum]|uniref:F-box protein n=1 Tax=Abeliophyllum distichum TaxID=126358 RepID=A0ABD1V5H0_9LAMI
MDQITSSQDYDTDGATAYGGDSTATNDLNNLDFLVGLSICQDYDYSSEIPDECLALIFQLLSSGDRKRCSLVCRRWLTVEGQSRHRLALNAAAEVSAHLPSIFTRFESITKLTIRCDRKSVSINDDALTLISLRCRNLTRFKIRGCSEISERGMNSLANNCESLRKFSCGSCSFGAEGMNALLNNCSSLEELSVKRLRGMKDSFAAEPIGLGTAASSLKSIVLEELYNGQCFGPLNYWVEKFENFEDTSVFWGLG